MALEDYDERWGTILSYAGILTLATGTVYCGSYASLSMAPYKDKMKKAGLVAPEDEPEEMPDRITSNEAWLFPIIGSIVLLGLYLVIIYFGTEWINWFMQWYFVLTGVLSVWKVLVTVAKSLIGLRNWGRMRTHRLSWKNSRRGIRYVLLEFKTLTALLFTVAAIPSILYALTDGRKPALLTDVLALSYAYNVLSILKLDSFRTGIILATGLFVYDVWWVFGTGVMVKVATALDVPIKIEWAKSLCFSPRNGFTMLGLGDIVIPGAFVGLALRYDAWRWSESLAHEKQRTHTNFLRPYFRTALCLYALGLLTTVVVVHVYQRAQPALLYLSPACLMSFFLPALWMGDLKQAWSWSDDVPEGDRTNSSRP